MGSSSRELDAFLQGLLVDSTKRLESMPVVGPSKDPLLLARERREEEDRARQAAAQARMAVIEEKASKHLDEEACWREQVRHRKETERRLAREAAEVAAAKVAALAVVPEPVDDSPLAAARRMWSADDMARGIAREEVAAAQRREAENWLDQEWLPRLNQHRDELRAHREGLARRERAALDAIAAAERRESADMGREDARSVAFRAQLTAECKHREALHKSVADPALDAAVKATLARKEQERCWALQREEARRQEVEEERRQEIARKDKEYAEWKQQVHAERCRRRRLEEREAPAREEDISEKRRLELQGRDFYREKEQQQMSVLEDMLKRASDHSKKIQDKGISPKEVLENTRKLAAKQREERIAKERDPARVEAELWDSLLAKNRLAKQQERMSRTPRWGVFDAGA